MSRCPALFRPLRQSRDHARLALWGRHEPQERDCCIGGSQARRRGDIAAGRDPETSEPFVPVDHVPNDSKGVFRWHRIPDGDRAIQAAQILAEFTGATVRL